MCDPVTLTAVSSGMSYLGGTSMLAGTSIGTGLINASTFINSSSSIFKASQAVTGVLSSPIASIGLSAMQGRQSGEADLQAAQNARLQQQQARDNADRERLKYRSEELERRKKYISDLSSSRALMAKYGYTSQSPSANALLRKNRETYMLDQNAIRMTGIDQVLAQERSAQTFGEEAKQLTKRGKRAPLNATLKGISDNFKTFRETAATKLLK